MAVALDHATGSATATFSLTNTAGNAILVGVCSGTGSSDVVTAVSYGGTALTKLGHRQSNGQGAGGCSLWGLVSGSLPTGANNVVVTGFVNWAGAATYTGAGSLGTPVVPTSPTDTSLRSSGSIAIPGTTTGGIVAAVTSFGNTGTPSATSPGSLRWQELINNSSAAGNGWFIDQTSAGGGASSTIAWTDVGSDWYGMVGVEILPVTATTHNGTVTAQVTAGASFSGTKTRFSSLTAAVTAHDIAGGINTRFGVFAAAVTTHTVIAATDIKFGHFNPAVTAHSTVGGTKTASGHLTAGVTAGMTAAGSKGDTASPALEASGFGTFSGISSGDTINHVTATINQWASTAAMGAPAYQLWDGTTAQIGTTQAGTVSTSTTHTDTVTWTGVTFSQLSTLRLRIYAHQGTATSGTTQSVDFVSLTVNYTGSGTASGVLAYGVTAGTIFGGKKTGLGHFVSTVTAQMAAVPASLHFRPPLNLGTVISQVPYAGSSASVTFSGSSTTGNTLASSFSQVSYGGTVVVLEGIPDVPPDEFTAAFTQVNYAGTIVPVTFAGASVNSNLLGIILSQVNTGGTAASHAYAGAVSGIVYSGTAVTPSSLLGVSMSQGVLAGSIAVNTFDGGAVGWSMQNVNLSLAEFNDIVLSATITSNGSALNLSTYTVKMLLKPSAGTADTDPSVTVLSSGGASPKITITSAPAGQCSIKISRTLTDESKKFYRIDVVDSSGDINTAAYGTLDYTAL